LTAVHLFQHKISNIRPRNFGYTFQAKLFTGSVFAGPFSIGEERRINQCPVEVGASELLFPPELICIHLVEEGSKEELLNKICLHVSFSDAECREKNYSFHPCRFHGGDNGRHGISYDIMRVKGITRAESAQYGVRSFH